MTIAQPLQLPGFIDHADCRAILAFKSAEVFQPARMVTAGRHNEELFRVDAELSLRLQDLLAARHSIRCMFDDLIEIYRYTPGQHIDLHVDSARSLANGMLSDATLLIYLNDDFEGGRTVFPSHDLSITPGAGNALLFAHGVPHAAEQVRTGTKFVARVNLAYGR